MVDNHELNVKQVITRVERRRVEVSTLPLFIVFNRVALNMQDQIEPALRKLSR